MSEIDWSKVPVDAKCKINSKRNDVSYNRHFAKFEGGKVFVFECGYTSWTNTSNLFAKYDPIEVELVED